MATFNKADHTWLPTIVKGGDFTEIELTLLEGVFDNQTNYDCDQIETQMKLEKQARLTCLYKVVIYPFEYTLTRIIFGSKDLDFKRSSFKIYKSYLNKKINYIEFKKRIANLYKDANIIVS